MNNYKLCIAYDGSRYCGWQIQKIKRGSKRIPASIQGAISQALKKILGEQVNLIGSGRTDSGVHALGQVAHFKSRTVLAVERIRAALNAVLPGDIRILSCQKVPLDFHARFDALSKVYRYYVHNEIYSSAFLRKYVYWYKHPLALAAMRRASRYLTGKHDFRAFCASGSGVASTVRSVKKITVKKEKIFGAECICVEIEANGFLYNMVRNIIGTLIDVGRRRRTPEYVKEVLRNKERSFAGPCVPAKGLFLMKVNY